MKKGIKEELIKLHSLKTMNEIIPGILEKEWRSIEKKISIVRPFAKTIHIDIIDGKFADNSSFLNPEPFKKYSKDFFLELHMMVEEPIQYLERFADAGFRRFLGHIEKMSDQEAFIKKARALNIEEVGFSVDGSTSLKDIKIPLLELDSLLIMTIHAGFSGQDFNMGFADKIREAKKKDPNGPVLEVDGGINDYTLKSAKKRGATRFVTTSYLFSSPDPQTAFTHLSFL